MPGICAVEKRYHTRSLINAITEEGETSSMLHGDISPSLGADGVSDNPGHTDASAIRGHSSQVTGPEAAPEWHKVRALLSARSWEPTGPGAVRQTGEGFTPPLTSQLLTATLIQHLGIWGKATHSNDFSCFRIKPSLGHRCLSALSTALT